MFARGLSLVICSGCLLLRPIAAVAQAAAPSGGAQLPPLDQPATYAGPPLSLTAAIEEASRNNPALIAAGQEAAAARQRPTQEGFLPPPMFTAQIWQWPINTLDPLNTNMYMFMVEQEIAGKGKRQLRITAAQKDADVAAQDVAVAANTIVNDLKRAYVTLAIVRKAAAIYADTAKILRQLGDVSEAKYSTGRISQQDVLKPAVELSKLYDEALRARQEADLAAAELNALMGRPVDSAIGPLDDIAPDAPLPDRASLVQLALDHHPELQAQRVAIERAKADAAVAKSERQPDFTVQGGYMLAPRGTDAWTGQVTMTWPDAPWTRGRQTAKVAQATANLNAAAGRLSAGETAVRLAVEQAYIKTKAAEQRVALLQTTIIPQLRQTLDSSRVGYESDRVDFLTLLDNQRMLVAEQLDYVRALGDLAGARADLERAIGVDLLSVTKPIVAGTAGSR